MNVSLRSQMTAGVAALGAAVVAVAPITQSDLLPSLQRVAASVELSSFSNPEGGHRGAKVALGATALSFVEVRNPADRGFRLSSQFTLRYC